MGRSVSVFFMPSYAEKLPVTGFLYAIICGSFRMEGVKQNERNYCRCRCTCGGYSVLLYPGRGAGGQMDGGNAKERGIRCRKERQITGILCRQQTAGGMRLINQRSAGTVIFGKENGRAVARKDVITFSRKIVRYKEICQCRNLVKQETANFVHMAGIPHVLVTVSRKLCGN